MVPGRVLQAGARDGESCLACNFFANSMFSSFLKDGLHLEGNPNPVFVQLTHANGVVVFGGRMAALPTRCSHRSEGLKRTSIFSQIEEPQNK
jgi:hypothetical protein